MSHLIKGFDCFRIALTRQPKYVVKAWLLSSLFRASVVTNGRRIRSVELPATFVAATTLESVFDNRRVSEFTRHTGRSADQLMIQNQPGTDSFGDGQSDEILCTFGAASKPNLRQCASICRVFKFNREACCFLERSLQIKVAPIKIWREYKALRS